jgi:hypothetical protein
MWQRFISLFQRKPKPVQLTLGEWQTILLVATKVVR